MSDDSIIQPKWEMTRYERSQLRRDRRRIMRQLVKGCEDSRPSFLPIPFTRRMRSKLRRKVPKGTIEWTLTVAAWLAWVLVAVLAGVDATRSGKEFPSVLYGHVELGIAVLVVGVICLWLVILDLISYRPRLLEESSGPAETFFSSLGRISPTLKDQVANVDGASPGTWQEVKELEQNLLAETNEFLVFDTVRKLITLRVLHRIAALIASLALVGYGLSTVTEGGLLIGDKVTAGTALPDHVYFTLVAFFTGFGDIGLVHNAVGYGYLALIVCVFTGVIYFILADVVSIQGEFKFNVRAAAEAFVLQKSSL